MKRASLIALTLCVAVAQADEPAATTAKMRWYRGNTHAHTVNADGNVAPDTVVRWYREHGYQFIFLTEHEFLADVAPLNALHGAQGKFLVLPGQEVTQVLTDAQHPDGRRHAHVNALGLNRVVMPISSEDGTIVARGVTMSDAYTRNFAAIRAAGGIPQVNHPNYRWSVKPQDLAQQSGPFLLEIANGFPSANNQGGVDDKGERALSTEAFWDALLSQGKNAWAVGSDDSHDYLHLDDPTSERPGKAWVVVRAPELSPAAILDALLKGEFYASNGVTLEDYVVDRSSVAITMKRPRDPRGTDDRRFTTRFIGEEGRVLAEVGGLKATYTFRGDEGYVRASITDSNGMRAWTQPVRLNARN
jgi:hypothetical protein